jgi:hypothetical protein
LPEVLDDKPEAIITEIGPYYWSDGIAAMLRNQTEWADLEWPTKIALRRYLFRQARRVIWKLMREEDRTNRKLLCAVVATNRYRGPIRTELLEDIDKAFAPLRRSMPELLRYCRTLTKAADERTATVDLALVAKAYRLLPEQSVDSFVRMMQRKWAPELATLERELSLYIRRRSVRVNAKSGRFEILPDEAA